MSTVAPRRHEFRLGDEASDLQAVWVPEAGMLGTSLTHRGEELLWTGQGVDEYLRSGAFLGIPFLHPWSNRLERFGYEAGDRTVELDPTSPLILHDSGGLPIHGVQSRSWKVLHADDSTLLAGLDFGRPELLAAFPFPHRIEMEIAIVGSTLTVAAALLPTADEPVPVAFGFHPYLRIPGLPRSEWEVSWPVRRRVVLDERLIPTGATEPADAIHGAIGTRTWDDGFECVEEAPRFTVRGGDRTIAVEFTEGFRVAQLFAPPGEDYICIEPMTAPANALVRGGFEWVAPGERRRAAFRIVCA
jgi:galactose mutarotase-like enzyme